jgi:hypothetical protein
MDVQLNIGSETNSHLQTFRVRTWMMAPRIVLIQLKLIPANFY